MPPRFGALLAILFWGVSFVATKAAVRELDPLALVLGRTLLGALLLLALLRLRGRPLLPPRDTWRSLAVMGFVGVAFHQTLQAQALTLTSAVSTGWLIALTPIWSALFAAFWLGERFSAQKLAGIVLGFAGTLLVVTRGRLDAGLLALPGTRGDLLVLASTLNWAFYTVLGHPMLRRLGPLPATSGAMVAGAVMLLPLAVARGGWQAWTQLSPTAWAAVLFLGIACSGLGYLFWYNALERLEASRVASLLYLEPLVTLAAARLLLAEPVGVSTVAGGLVMLAGVALVQRAPAPSVAGAPGLASEQAEAGPTDA